MSLCPMLKETLENSYTILQILQILYVSANWCIDGNWRNVFMCVYMYDPGQINAILLFNKKIFYEIMP